MRLLAENHWPWRLHATYDETIARALDVFEKVNRDVPFDGMHWFFDHAETISDRNIDRIAALGGGIAVQHRMAYQGEYFVERYGAKAAERDAADRADAGRGVPVGAGTDATRVASYNPWVSLSWLVTGKTVGGLRALSAGQPARPGDGAAPLDRGEHLVLQRRRARRGRSRPANSPTLPCSTTISRVPESEIVDIASVLTCSAARWFMATATSSLPRRYPAPCPTGRRCDASAAITQSLDRARARHGCGLRLRNTCARAWP